MNRCLGDGGLRGLELERRRRREDLQEDSLEALVAVAKGDPHRDRREIVPLLQLLEEPANAGKVCLDFDGGPGEERRATEDAKPTCRRPFPLARLAVHA